MKRLNLLALASLLLLSVVLSVAVVGCSEPDVPAAGGAMMNDSKMKDGESMKKEEGGMMKDDAMMKDGGMMKDDKMMKEDGK